MRTGLLIIYKALKDEIWRGFYIYFYNQWFYFTNSNMSNTVNHNILLNSFLHMTGRELGFCIMCEL